MELSRGICILCTASTKVVLPPQAEYITNLLCEILKNHIDVQKFTEISSTLKVCPLCLHDILQVSEHGNKFEELSENIDNCSMCQGDQYLVLVTEWAHFNKLIETVGFQRRKKCTVCLRCIKYLDLYNRIKVNFLKKYPHLELSEASKDKIKYNKMKTNNNNTSLSTLEDHQSSFSYQSNRDFDGELSTSRTNVTSNLSVALKHLQPLTCSNINIQDYKGDSKLLEQVAYVKLDGSTVRRSHSRHGFKKSNKHNSSSESVTSPETSPKPSFFKIRLKLNPNKSSKSYKVMTGKVSKPKNKLSLSRNKKELIVKVLKIDLDEAKRRNSVDLSEEELSIRTPTKASRKMLPEHTTSSSKKRKSVTFAEDLNVEIVDGVSSRKNNTEGTPLKSLLKKSTSPTTELFKNGSAEYPCEDDSELVNNFIHNVNLCKDWTDETNASESYMKEIRKKDVSFIDSLIESKDSEMLPDNRREGSDKESDAEENDEANSESNKRNNKKRRSSDNDSEIQSDSKLDEGVIHQENDDEMLNSKKANKRRRTENSDSETKTEELMIETPDKTNNDENSIEDHTNESRRRKSNDETVTREEAQNNEHTEHDKSPLEDSQENPNETVTNPKKLISHLDSAISVSSDSSKEDRLITLDEYKKIRKSIDQIDGSDDSGKNESITTSSEDISLSQEPENKPTNHEKLDEPESNEDKVSDDDGNQSDTQPEKVHEQPPEAPADGVTTNKPIVDNDNNVSDNENSGLAEEDAEQQKQVAESQEKEKLTVEESPSVACVTTDDAGEVFSSVDAENELTQRNGTPDEPDLDRSDTYVSVSCSSDSYVTAIDGDKLLNNSPVK